MQSKTRQALDHYPLIFSSRQATRRGRLPGRDECGKKTLPHYHKRILISENVAKFSDLTQTTQGHTATAQLHAYHANQQQQNSNQEQFCDHKKSIQHSVTYNNSNYYKL